MSLLDENRATILSKIQDKSDHLASPSLKSKTPVPKKVHKEKLKYKKLKRPNTPKIEKPNLKGNTNALRESYSSCLGRAKNKGSISVELFNGTKEIQRPHSVISKSLFNHLDLAQKVKTLNKNPNNLNIDKIIKKSLLKARSNKITKEKDQKQNLIQNEIRRQEIKYQNNQIRFQNFQKTRKKSKKSKKRPEKQKIFLDSIQKNNKSDSCSKNYLNKVQELYQREYKRNFNSNLKDYLIRKNSGSFEDLSDIQVNDQSDESENHKNFSFVQTENLKKKKNDTIDEEQLSKSLDLSIHRYEEGYFRETKKKNQSLTFQTQSSFKIAKLPTILSLESTHLKIDPVAKPSLQSSLQSQVSVESTQQVISLVPQSGVTLLSKSSTTLLHSFKIEPDCQEKNNLIEQISEELAGSLSYLFLVEQLKLFELSTLHDLSKLIPEDRFKALSFQIENKYSSVIGFVQPDLELRTAKYVNKLSRSQNSEFLQKTQRKKQGFHQLLNSLSEEFSKKFGEEASESSSSSDRGQGISHSRSVISLHDDFLKNPEEILKEVDFGYKGNISDLDIQSLNIDLKPVEIENECPSILNTESTLKYAKKVLSSMNQDKVIQAVEQPLLRNPLAELDKIQDLQIGTFTDTEIQKFELLFNYNEALSIDLHDQTNEYKDKETQKIEKIFKSLILDNINYLLQQFRPYGYNGKPLPWVEKKVYFYKGIENFEGISEKILADLGGILSCEIGKHEELDISDFAEERVIMKYKESQLDRIVFFEIKEEEKKWLCYEFEEAQVKIDLADVILYEIISEVIQLNNF